EDDGVGQGDPGDHNAVVRPARRRDLAIRPVQFPGDRQTVKLPGRPREVCPAAGGRFLCLHCADERKLGLFDVSESAVVKAIPTTGPESHIAAGASALLISDNAARKLHRYDLRTLEQDKEAPYPFEGPVKAIAIGHESYGPLLVLGDGPPDAWPVHFLDL